MRHTVARAAGGVARQFTRVRRLHARVGHLRGAAEPQGDDQRGEDRRCSCCGIGSIGTEGHHVDHVRHARVLLYVGVVRRLEARLPTPDAVSLLRHCDVTVTSRNLLLWPVDGAVGRLRAGYG